MSAELIDPTASEHEPSARAERRALDGARIGLVDGMLNPSADWGQGLLDGVEAALRSEFPAATFERVSRPQLSPSPHDVWASAMADRYKALVIAAGD